VTITDKINFITNQVSLICGQSEISDYREVKLLIKIICTLQIMWW